MKSIRQKRIEDDNNKEWAQVRYNKAEHTDRSLPNFDNTQYWNGINEGSTWITNGTRGVALPDPYYNGYKVSDEYTEPINDLLIYIGLMKSITVQMNAMGILITGSIMTEVGKLIYEGYRGKVAIAFLRALMGNEGKPHETTTEEAANVKKWSYGTAKAEALSNAVASACVAGVLFFLAMGLIAGNTYKDIYDAWNSFEQDSITAQNKVDTEGYYDADGNWHWKWSGYQVKYDIDYGNTTTTQSSAMKLFKYHQLKRGRYQSKAYSNSSVVYTFEYTKSITYIPA